MKIKLESVSPSSEEDVCLAESGLGVRFPKDYREFVKVYSGSTAEENCLRRSSLSDGVERFLRVREIADDGLRALLALDDGTFPIASSPGGNYYLMDGAGNVSFLHHELDEPTKVASSFSEFLRNLEPEKVKPTEAVVISVWKNPDRERMIAETLREMREEEERAKAPLRPPYEEAEVVLAESGLPFPLPSDYRAFLLSTAATNFRRSLFWAVKKSFQSSVERFIPPSELVQAQSERRSVVPSDCILVGWCWQDSLLLLHRGGEVLFWYKEENVIFPQAKTFSLFLKKLTPM